MVIRGYLFMNASFKKNRLSLILSMVATLSVALVGCNDGGQGKKDDPKPDDPIYDNVYDVKVTKYDINRVFYLAHLVL